MEERKSWLPAGLEGSGWEPDDRASQRRDARSKRSGSGPDASSPWQPQAEKPDRSASESSGTWEPYDPDRPETKRARKGDTDEAGAEAADPRGDQKADEEAAPKARRSEKKARRSEKPDRERAAQQNRRSDVDAEGGGRSDVDAMGQDKHRQVAGQRYGASRAKQFAYYGIFIAFVIAAYLGLKVAVDHFDKAPAHDKAQAPWAKPSSPDEPLGGFTPKSKGQKGPTHFQ